MGDGLVRGGRPSEGDRIVLGRGLEVGGLVRWVLPGGVTGRGYLLALGVNRQGDGQAQDRQDCKN